MKKRMLSIILTVCIIMSAFAAMSVSASAAESGKCGDNLTWTLDDEGTLTISGTGKMWDYDSSPWDDFSYKILSLIIEDGVTSVGNCAFNDCYNLTSITIPDNVTSIGKWAFAQCSKLTNINIPDKVISIGSMAFAYCTSLLSITIPKNVTSMGGMVFAYCSSLTDVTISDGITFIGESTFSHCTKLTNIVLPNSITIIDRGLFSQCYNLKNITIPDSVTVIDYSAFFDCSRLTDIYYLSNKENWDKIDIKSNGNEKLTSANIHYSSLTGKISTAEYDGAKLSGKVNFDYSEKNGTLYLALFDNSGRLEKFVKYDVPKGLKSQDFEIPVADASGHSLKAMFWDGNITPLGLSDEVTIK